MDTQHHQIKNTSSGPGSHGVHLCHKCRWPFPNANPSAKLRRSHKKVCGTIEGYKLFESDDHLTAIEGGHASEEIPSTSDNPVTEIPSIKTPNLQVIEQVKDHLENYNPFSEAIIEDVSVVTLQSDTATSGSAGGPSEKSHSALQICEGAAVKSDDFAPPSLMTSVEPGNGVPEEATPLSSTQQDPKAEDLKAGLFSSTSNVVNELQGRKQNEEIIAKESNPSTITTPVKSLLGEVIKSPNIKQPPSTTRNDDDMSLKSTTTAVTTMESILRSERNDKERESHPVETKKEKRKSWLSFVCCSPAVDRDL